MSKRLPGHVALEVVRLWAARGSNPRSIKQQQFEYSYIFAAVYPSAGATEALILPVINSGHLADEFENITTSLFVGA